MRDGALADERHAMSGISERQKDQVSIWFMTLRDRIVRVFEHLEAQHSEGPFF